MFRASISYGEEEIKIFFYNNNTLQKQTSSWCLQIKENFSLCLFCFLFCFLIDLNTYLEQTTMQHMVHRFLDIQCKEDSFLGLYAQKVSPGLKLDLV